MKTSRFRHVWMSYFTYTRSEKNAAMVLTGLLLVMQTYLWFRHYTDVPGEYQLTAEEARQFQQLEGQKNSKSFKREEAASVKSKPVLTVFDPNETDSAGFVALGMSPKQAASLLRYRDRIGGFKDKAAVQKVKVLKPELYAQWEPFIDLKKVEAPPAKQKSGLFQKKKQELPILDLNRADTIALQDLPLIGSGRARAIANYRERLGGYISVEQLQEVKAIPDSVYEVILPYLKVVSGPYRKLDINHLPADSLRHPYLNKQLARMIVSYREQHGVFKTYQDLGKLPLVNAEILSKLAPYLTFNP
ncbi:MAG: helix-hairpin-helix domain-containing protein [Bacteroidetes bacterium]|nr:helix-hairpin-helix domain-containing protein [Bacteroidota bacterium]